MIEAPLEGEKDMLHVKLTFNKHQLKKHLWHSVSANKKVYSILKVHRPDLHCETDI